MMIDRNTDIQPHDWLWRKGYDLIKRSADNDKLASGEFYILDTTAANIDNVTLDQLPKHP
jgi:hypothetical protein